MSTSHLPRDKKDRSVRARKHDPYKGKGKLPEPSVCPQCKVLYHKGRWTWGPAPSGSHEVVSLPANGFETARRAGCCCSRGNLWPRIGRRFSGLPTMKRLASKPNIPWRESSRSRIKSKHPKEWSSPRPTPTSHGASAKSCITHITAPLPVDMKKPRICSGRTGKASGRGRSLCG